MTDSDDHRVVGIEVLGIKLLGGVFDLCAPLVAILGFHLQQFVFHHLLAEFRIVEDRLQVSDEFLQFIIFCMELVHTEVCEL